jgi:hypothetical protein
VRHLQLQAVITAAIKNDLCKLIYIKTTLRTERNFDDFSFFIFDKDSSKWIPLYLNRN